MKVNVLHIVFLAKINKFYYPSRQRLLSKIREKNSVFDITNLYHIYSQQYRDGKNQSYILQEKVTGSSQFLREQKKYSCYQAQEKYSHIGSIFKPLQYRTFMYSQHSQTSKKQVAEIGTKVKTIS